jgi:hypothetical protein
MKVEILSGSQRGAVVDMPKTEAEINIATGFARSLEAPVASEATAAEAPATSKPSKRARASKG